MTLLTLDPSSTRVGYALTKGSPFTIVEAGLLTPRKVSAPAMARILSLESQVVALVVQLNPSLVVIESPTGKVYQSAHRSHGKGMSTYGAAFGCVWSVCRRLRPGAVYLADTEWTQRRRKDKRAASLAVEFPKVDWSRDTGHDMADAIGLAKWWWANQKLSQPAESP